MIIVYLMKNYNTVPKLNGGRLIRFFSFIINGSSNQKVVLEGYAQKNGLRAYATLPKGSFRTRAGIITGNRAGQNRWEEI